MLISVIKDTLADGLKMLPFLFAAYLLIEYVEHRHSASMERVLAGGGKTGFLAGAFLGLVPQCGFSAMAADLYASNVITVGTLISVFVATSDEAIPVLISEPKLWPVILKLLIIKLIAASLCGFLIDNVFRKFLPASIHGGYQGKIEEIDCHEHKEEEGILQAALRHTLHIFFFILIFTFLLNIIMTAAGTENLSRFLNASGVLQVFAAGLVGMIPNCAASVLITQMFAAGQLGFPGLLAGLCTGAGIGPLVLLRTCRNKKQAVLVLILLYGTGVLIGLLDLAFFH